MSTKAWAEGTLGKTRGETPKVIFGQVREDPEVEMAAAMRAPGKGRWFAIASAGCTTFSLLTLKPGRLDAIDINPAQVHLLELKRLVLARDSPDEIREAFERDGIAALLRHGAGLPRHSAMFWRQQLGTLRQGLLNCGVADRKLPYAMGLFRLTVHGRGQIRRLLSHSALAQQQPFVRECWINWRWRFAISCVLNPKMLRLVYGRAFTDRIPSNAAAQVRAAFEHVLLSFPAATNGYLWQMLAEGYPPNDDARPPYLRGRISPETLSALEAHHAEATEWLSAQESGSIQFFALSNILELAPPETAERLAHEVTRTAAPGAIAVTRAIFPKHAPRLSHPQLVEDLELQQHLSAIDRTPVCRGVRVFRVAG